MSRSACGAPPSRARARAARRAASRAPARRRARRRKPTGCQQARSAAKSGTAAGGSDPAVEIAAAGADSVAVTPRYSLREVAEGWPGWPGVAAGGRGWLGGRGWPGVAAGGRGRPAWPGWPGVAAGGRGWPGVAGRRPVPSLRRSQAGDRTRRRPHRRGATAGQRRTERGCGSPAGQNRQTGPAETEVGDRFPSCCLPVANLGQKPPGLAICSGDQSAVPSSGPLRARTAPTTDRPPFGAVVRR